MAAENPTYYYSIDYQELEKLIVNAEIDQTAESIRNVLFEDSTELSVEEIKRTKLCGLSQNRSEIKTTKKITTKQSQNDLLTIRDVDNIAAAALPKTALEGEKQPEDSNLSNSQLSAASEQINDNLSFSAQNDHQDKSVGKVDHIVNSTTRLDKLAEHQRPSRSKWKESIQDLDKAGIPSNKTLINLLKLYPKEKVDSAIALFKTRKREQYIPNPAGYFTSALKGDWASKSLMNDGDSEIDTQAVFRHWYDLARELGYCSGQEMREGEQWVCVSGAWESWSSAVDRGYSLDYLKKVVRRNKG